MKYASIDIETTGVDNENSQTLSIGIVLEDSNNILPVEELPKLEIAVIRERLAGEIFAFNMNRDLISDILSYKLARTDDERRDIIEATGREYLPEEEVVERIFHFMFDHGVLDGGAEFTADKKVKVVNGRVYPMLTSNMKPYYFNAAGKNFATFDQKFLERLPRWKQVFKIRSRVLDPGILFVDWKNDESIPSLQTCKERAGITGIVTHNAVEDAIDVVLCLRKQYC